MGNYDNYIETSAILLSLDDSEMGEETRNMLFKMKGSSAVSDLVLAEIYNLPEPLKDRSTRLVCQLGVPSMRLSPSCIALAKKYAYNRVVEGSQFDCGLHVAVATVRGFNKMLTSDPFIVSQLLPGANPVNVREGYGEVEAEPCDSGDGSDHWFGELRKVRDISYQATSRMDVKGVLEGIETSAMHLMREKSVKIERTGSIEIF